jgi:hypothetical protein
VNQNGITIWMRHFTNRADLREESIAGKDRKATLEAAVGRVAEPLRADLRRQLGRCIEHSNEQITGEAYDEVTRSGAVVRVTPCEVIA